MSTGCRAQRALRKRDDLPGGNRPGRSSAAVQRAERAGADATVVKADEGKRNGMEY